MKTAGVIILIIGLAVTVLTGLNFVTSNSMVNPGKLEISVKENYSLSWSPVISSVIMVVGAAFFIIGIKVNDRMFNSLARS
jgi:hypothetical protein